MNQSNQTLPQCIRANAEKIGAFLIGGCVMGLFYALVFVTFTAGG
jgi:hypothetical protein